MNKSIIALSYAFCWGVGVTLTKLALSEITAATLLVIQLLSSVLFLATVSYLQEHKLPFSWQRLKQGFAGICEPGLAYMFGIFGVKLTSVGNATLIASSEVILTVVLAAVFLGERLTRSKVMMAGISLAGITLLLLNNGQAGGYTSLVGDLLILMGTLFAVLYALLSKKQIETNNPIQLTTSQQTVGLVTTIICFSILAHFDSAYTINLANIPFRFLLLAVASGILQYALAFFLYLVVLKNLPVSHAAFYLALIPVFGIVSAAILLGEQPSLVQWLGGLLIIASSCCAGKLKAA